MSVDTAHCQEHVPAELGDINDDEKSTALDIMARSADRARSVHIRSAFRAPAHDTERPDLSRLQRPAFDHIMWCM